MSNPQDPYDPSQSQQPGGLPPPGQGGYPEAQPGYQGGMPPPPGDHTERPVRRPGVVVAAAVLWVLTGLLFLLAGLATALAGGNAEVQEELDNAFAQSGLTVDTDILQQGIVVTGVVLAVVGALLVIGALLMLRRSNAARILLTVLGVIVALLLLGTVIGTIVVLVAIVLQFLPAANAWFRAPRSAV